MLNNINQNFPDTPHVVIDSLKNIISYNLKGIDHINIVLNKTPQKGQPVVDIFPQEQSSYVSEIIDRCLAGNTAMADLSLVKQIAKSSLNIQILFIPLFLYDDSPHAICLFLPGFCQHIGILPPNYYSRFASHELRAPVSNILSLANSENYSWSKLGHGTKIKELLKNIYNQAEKLNHIIATLNDLVAPKRWGDENSNYEKIASNHIVLVDDDPLMNMMHKMIISKYKKKALIKVFDNPQKALEYIYLNKPDLIFLDINMPEIDGWTFLQRLEAYSFEFPVIIVSSSIDPVERMKAYTYKSVKEFIVKPLTYEKLVPLFIEF